MSSVAVAYAVDSRSVLPLAVSLRALRRHAVLLPEIYVLENGVSLSDQARVEKASGVKPRWVSIDPMKKLPDGLRMSEATYYRLWLPELLPELEQALYLDADTLPLTDVAPLLSLAAGKFPLQACLDFRGEISNPLLHFPNFAQLGLSPNDPLFSTGVMLLNLKLWREEGISAKVAELGRAHPETTYLADQVALSVTLKGRVRELPPEWNVQTVPPGAVSGEWNVPVLPQNIVGAKILHYAGELKPWTPGGKDLPGAMAWLKERAQLSWE